ncbi:MAG: zeta toxin family protein [Betaproteobacteria bacterium]|jgi:hypothetical protein|nr:zeta toxin family protein [Betaproteobacteria bacterium]
MDTAVDCGETAFGPWNPGITSHIPREIRHLATIFRPENVFTDLARAEELRDLTGLDCSELVTFRPERLALHELLIRVTADFSVPDGSKIEDLGINFRRIVGVLLTRYIEPDMGAIRAAYDRSRNRIAAVIATELAALFPSPASAAATRTRSPATRIRAFFAREERARATSPDSGTDATGAAIAAWEAGARTGTDALRRAACRALARVASALFVRHGRIWADRDTIAALAEDLACNAYGSEEIGRLIEPMLMKAVAPEGFTLLPRQERPVVMNTKGASASGKSTLRPRQKELAEAIGVRWSEFALISPDIWRKQLLDYASLGPAYKYGGAFTGEELQIIDQKLDRYMARKAERGEMTHLLIDRFRFDSFAPDSDEAGSNLLTRFGHSVYLFFMITPPESLVERAWKRGLEVGRYKAVDDTLGHGIEAYSGMPQLFFTWVRRTDKRVHFEFLDNSVRLGERPRTVAFGSNGALNVLDVKCLLDVERYRRVNVDATVPEDLYPDAAMLRPDRNAGFLRQCVERFAEVNFADQATGRIYLSIASGAPVWCDRDALRLAMASDDARAGIEVAAPAALVDALPPSDAPRYLGRQPGAQRFDTLGAWGTST